MCALGVLDSTMTATATHIMKQKLRDGMHSVAGVTVWDIVLSWCLLLFNHL
jgi:hypothetical protein